MVFNDHKNLKGLHSFLSPSKYHWLRYDEEKLISTYNNFLSVARGTELHEFAAMCIKLGKKLYKSKTTLDMYVNDAIGYKMTPEQPLYYSENCFGTADAICFRNNFLRIHDLKTGDTPANIEQLYIYAGLFCLEYNQPPEKIKSELRIYQFNQILYEEPSTNSLIDVMDKIISSDKIIEKIKIEQGGV